MTRVADHIVSVSGTHVLGRHARRASQRICSLACAVVLAACGSSPRGSVQTSVDASAADSGDVCPQVLSTSCPTQVPSYQSEIASLVQQRCLGCHGPGGTAYPARDFTSYAKVYAQRRNMLGMVYSCTMPPLGATPLAAQERRDLLTWFVCNAPDN